jgi:hypothetical protein
VARASRWLGVLVAVLDDDLGEVVGIARVLLGGEPGLKELGRRRLEIGPFYLARHAEIGPFLQVSLDGRSYQLIDQ